MEVRYSSRILCIEYFADLVPPGGSEVHRSVATFQKSHGKDPAGHSFHAFARKQSGILGTLFLSDAAVNVHHIVVGAELVYIRHVKRALWAFFTIHVTSVGTVCEVQATRFTACLLVCRSTDVCLYRLIHLLAEFSKESVQMKLMKRMTMTLLRPNSLTVILLPSTWLMSNPRQGKGCVNSVSRAVCSTNIILTFM